MLMVGSLQSHAPVHDSCGFHPRFRQFSWTETTDDLYPSQKIGPESATHLFSLYGGAWSLFNYFQEGEASVDSDYVS